MSKERELLKECRLMLDNPINGTAGRNLQIRITELIAQPEGITPREGLTEYKKGCAKAELDLKREPIDEEELEVWYSQHTWAMDKQEYMWGFRDAEKAYGIGVE
jgi:hypothetical protein